MSEQWDLLTETTCYYLCLSWEHSCYLNTFREHVETRQSEMATLGKCRHVGTTMSRDSSMA